MPTKKIVTYSRAAYSPARRRRAASMIQRTWKKRRVTAITKRRREIGTGVWEKGNCKSNVSYDDDQTAFLSGTLHFDECTKILQGSDPNNRERGIVNMRGFKTFYQFQNTSGSLALYVNIAMIAPKSTNTTNGDGVTTQLFFRAHSSGRGQDFNPVAQSAFRSHILSINPDDYTVLWHKRRILAPNQAGAPSWNNNRGNAMWLFKKYTKLNRRVTYGSAEASAATDGRVFVAFWVGLTQPGPGQVPTSAVTVAKRCVSYFKEAKD